MFLARPAVFALATCSLLACSGNDLTTPADIDPLFAKPVKIQEPVIQEFWVVPGPENAPDIIHVVVSDNVFTVDPSLVFDYFHNGIVDDDPPYDQHFEILASGPPASYVEDLHNGWVHVDVPWDGGGKNPDHLTIEIPGEGDPFSIFLPLKDAGGNTLDWARPRGVVVGGAETHEAEIDLEAYLAAHPGVSLVLGSDHHPSAVRSFVATKGYSSDQYMSLSGLTMADLQCQKATTTTGKGKDKVVETVYRLSANISISVDRPSTPPDPDEWNVWWEGHFWVVGSDEVSYRAAASNVGDYGVTLAMPPSWDGSGVVEFVVDFISGLGQTKDIVYNPWLNQVSTTAGFSSDLWENVYPFGDGFPNSRTGLEDGMAVPVAHSIQIPVDCR